MKFCIKGSPPSKSNSYRIITIKSKTGKSHGSLAKSPALKQYESNFYLQIPPSYRRLRLSGLLHVELSCYYASMRSDLDNAAKCILDCLQRAQIISNDNLVMELIMTKHIDKLNPRVEITLYEIS